MLQIASRTYEQPPPGGCFDLMNQEATVVQERHL